MVITQSLGLEQKSFEQPRQEFEVNYFGYLRMITAVLLHMKSRRTGIIHNMSSGVGITGFPGIYGYASTKGAIEPLTRTLALEFARYGIQVTLMLLAFLLHTVLQLCDQAHQQVRLRLATRKTFFDDLRALTRYLFFASWDDLLAFMLSQLTPPQTDALPHI